MVYKAACVEPNPYSSVFPNVTIRKRGGGRRQKELARNSFGEIGQGSFASPCDKTILSDLVDS